MIHYTYYEGEFFRDGLPICTREELDEMVRDRCEMTRATFSDAAMERIDEIAFGPPDCELTDGRPR